jgi:pimeloyl-ACP methyl ester carboxylesterase
LFGFALTPQYAEDIALVIETLQRETPLPIWLVGTSSGAGRLAFVTPQIQDRVKIAGVVLTSTPWSSSKRVPISGWGLGKITVPTLVVHHRNDQCADCKPDAAATFMSLIGAQSKSIEWIDGGNAMGNPCWAMGHHGFNGVEQQAVDVVVHWMSDKR